MKEPHDAVIPRVDQTLDVDRVLLEVFGPPAHELDEVVSAPEVSLLRHLGSRNPLQLLGHNPGVPCSRKVVALNTLDEGLDYGADDLDVLL